MVATLLSKTKKVYMKVQEKIKILKRIIKDAEDLQFQSNAGAEDWGCHGIIGTARLIINFLEDKN
jgi:hypothetical protein